MTDTPGIKKKNGLMGALGWVFALILACWAMAVSRDHPFAAALLFVAAAGTMPIVHRKAVVSRKPGTPKWTLSAAIAMFAIAGITLGAVPNPADVEEAKDPVASVVRFQAQHLALTQPCNAGFQAIADEALSARPDRQRMYDLAASAQQSCRVARDTLPDIDPPRGLTIEEGSRFFEANKSCDLAYMLAEQAAGKLKTAIDEGMQPSQVAAFRDKTNEAVGYRRACDTLLAQAAELAVAAHSEMGAAATADTKTGG